MPDQRYFTVDDGGCEYFIVARDAEHAKEILVDAGVHFTDDEGDSAPPDWEGFDHLTYDEIPLEKALTMKVWRGTDGTGPHVFITECHLGEWFCTEV